MAERIAETSNDAESSNVVYIGEPGPVEPTAADPPDRTDNQQAQCNHDPTPVQQGHHPHIHNHHHHQHHPTSHLHMHHHRPCQKHAHHHEHQCSAENVVPNKQDIEGIGPHPIYKPPRTEHEVNDETNDRKDIVSDLKEQRIAEESASDDEDEEECEIDDKMWEKLEKRCPPSISDLNLAERTWVRRILMLYNPYSGRQRGERLAKRSLRLFSKLDIEVEAVRLEYPGHAELICATMNVNAKKRERSESDVLAGASHIHPGTEEESGRAIKAMLERQCSTEDLKSVEKQEKQKDSPSDESIGWDLICAVGGDGTFHECINGIMQRKAKGLPVLPLSLIAAGTGNSFMLELGLRDWKTAVYHIARGVHYPIDICELHFGDGEVCYSFNSIHWGMASRVLVRAEKLRWMGTAIRYTTAAMIEMLNGKTQLAKITVRDADDKLIEFDEEFSFAIANNIITAARGMKMAPNAKIDDGLIDLLLVTSHNSLNLMTMFRKTYDGSHTELPYVHYLQCKSFSITPYKREEEEARVKLEREARGEVETTVEEIEELEEILDVDGELKGCTPLSCVVLPRSLRVIL